MRLGIIHWRVTTTHEHVIVAATISIHDKIMAYYITLWLRIPILVRWSNMLRKIIKVHVLSILHLKYLTFMVFKSFRKCYCSKLWLNTYVWIIFALVNVNIFQNSKQIEGLRRQHTIYNAHHLWITITEEFSAAAFQFMGNTHK